MLYSKYFLRKLDGKKNTEVKKYFNAITQNFYKANLQKSVF